MEGECFFVEGEGLLLDVRAFISSCKSAQKHEYGKANLAAEADFDQSLEVHDEKVRELLRRWKDVFQPLLPTATVEKLVSMNLGLLKDH